MYKHYFLLNSINSMVRETQPASIQKPIDNIHQVNLLH